MKLAHQAIIYAYERGYRVTPDGSNVISPSGKVLKLAVSDSGYLRFGVKLPGYGKFVVPVHRLQAFQKFGDRIFADGIHVRHLDGNQKNNSEANLELGTALQNAMDKTPWARGAGGRSHRRLNYAEILAHYFATGFEATLKRFQIARSTLSYILNHPSTSPTP